VYDFPSAVESPVTVIPGIIIYQKGNEIWARLEEGIGEGEKIFCELFSMTGQKLIWTEKFLGSKEDEKLFVVGEMASGIYVGRFRITGNIVIRKIFIYGE
jgi:hypothetical protein